MIPCGNKICIGEGFFLNADVKEIGIKLLNPVGRTVSSSGTTGGGLAPGEHGGGWGRDLWEFPSYLSLAYDLVGQENLLPPLLCSLTGPVIKSTREINRRK